MWRKESFKNTSKIIGDSPTKNVTSVTKRLKFTKSKKMFSSITLEMQVEVPIFSFSSCFDYTKLCYCRRTTIHTGAKLYFSINSISNVRILKPNLRFSLFRDKICILQFWNILHFTIWNCIFSSAKIEFGRKFLVLSKCGYTAFLRENVKAQEFWVLLQ